MTRALMPKRCKCCCGKCHYSLRCDECCGCAPKEICVSITATGEGCTCSATAYAVAEYDCYTEAWSGVILCGDLTFDFDVYIESDGYGQCSLKLESSCLAEILSAAMNAPLTNPADEYGPGCRNFSATWEGVSHTCGDANCTSLDITVAAAERFEVPTNCDGDCENCRCACKTLCILISSNDCVELVTAVVDLTYNVPTWVFSVDCNGTTIDGTISLEDDGYGCALVLSSSEGDGEAIVQTDCPHLLGSWAVGDPAGISITATCKECGPCDTEIEGCCTPKEWETSLPATLTISMCGCSGTLSLGGATIFDGWTGSITCGVDDEDPPNPRTYGVTLTCSSDALGQNAWELRIQTCPETGPDIITFIPVSVVCDPLNAGVPFILTYSGTGFGCPPSECVEPFPIVITE
jgi:hypothetical protein